MSKWMEYVRLYASSGAPTMTLVWGFEHNDDDDDWINCTHECANNARKSHTPMQNPWPGIKYISSIPEVNSILGPTRAVVFVGLIGKELAVNLSAKYLNVSR